MEGGSPELAGRLLEAAGDRRPRGMIASALRGDPGARQNSAYRATSTRAPELSAWALGFCGHEKRRRLASYAREPDMDPA